MRNKLRVGIVGVGNCASSLVQGIAHYQNAADDADVPGLMHANLGGYRVRDIDFSCAFDVSAVKVGRPLSEAIAAEPNNTLQFSAAPANDVIVARGPTMDGVGHYLREVVKESNVTPVDVAGTLRESGTDVLVCYLPVGSDAAMPARRSPPAAALSIAFRRSSPAMPNGPPAFRQPVFLSSETI